MLHSALSDTSTSLVAGVAVVSPWFLPQLEQVSTHAALLLPILGCVWLLMQIIAKAKERFKKK